MSEGPIVAIVGGVRPETLEGLSPEESEKCVGSYRETCRRLGACLAESRMRLLVWSSDPRFIERDVVDGFLGVPSPRRNSIICIWNQDHYPDFPHQDKNGGPILLKRSHHDEWEIGFYESIKKEADAIVLLGGGATTLIAGLVAASWGKALFATPHYHGKAEMLYKWMHTTSNSVASAPISEEDIDLMSRPWSPENCVSSLQRQLDGIARRREREQSRADYQSWVEERLSQTQSSNRRSVAVVLMMMAFIASMAVAISLENGILDFIAFFGVLVFGGALGASLSLLGTQRDSTLSSWSAAVVGAGIGVIVGVVQISPNITQFFPNAELSQVDMPLVFSSAVFALLGGLAFESSLQSLISRAGSIERSESTGKVRKPAGNRAAPSRRR